MFVGSPVNVQPFSVNNVGQIVQMSDREAWAGSPYEGIGANRLRVPQMKPEVKFCRGKIDDLVIETQLQYVTIDTLKAELAGKEVTLLEMLTNLARVHEEYKALHQS